MRHYTTNIELNAIYKLIDTVNDYAGEELTGEELFYHAYNEDYEYIYTSEAVKDLEEYGVFKAIEEVKTYEQDNFGEVATDFSEPCKVANMLFYIIGEEIIAHLDLDYSEEISEEQTEEITEELRDMIAA